MKNKRRSTASSSSHQKIGEQSHGIQTATEVLAELDLQFAKARFAEDYNCVRYMLDQEEPRGDAALSCQRAQLACFFTRPAIHCWNEILSKGLNAVPISLELEGPPPVDHHRPKHWRKNRLPENRGPAGPDGTIRNPSPSRPRRHAQSSTRSWPTSETRNPSSKISPHFLLT